MSEYSYFRAEGRSLTAIKEVIETKEYLEKMSKKIANKYGGERWSFWYRRPDGTTSLGYFFYDDADKVPENFAISQKDQAHDVWAEPKPGTTVAFGLASLVGLLEKKQKCTLLDGVFGCGEIPMKELPAGEYEGAFVKEYSLKEKNTPGRVGKLRDQTTMCFSSNGAHKSWDPLDFMHLEGDWYIRVPNDETGKPRMTPPDAVLMDYALMLELDSIEFALSASRRRIHPVPKP